MSEYIVCKKKRNSPRLSPRVCEEKCPEKGHCKQYLAYLNARVSPETVRDAQEALSPS